MNCLRFHHQGNYHLGLFRGGFISDHSRRPARLDLEFASLAKWFGHLPNPYEGNSLGLMVRPDRHLLRSAFTPQGLARYEREIKARIAVLDVPIVSTPVPLLMADVVYRDRWQIVYLVPTDKPVR